MSLMRGPRVGVSMECVVGEDSEGADVGYGVCVWLMDFKRVFLLERILLAVIFCVLLIEFV